MSAALSLDLSSLAAAYAAGATPVQIVREVYARIAARGDDHAWISLFPEETVLAEAAALERRRASGESLPLFGVPFAVKDNLDVVGLPTTAACPAFSYKPDADAEVVRRLRAAGALVIGKTNLDQFATGLVGVRSPYGAPSSVFDDDYISGGSSSGSAVAVAAGIVSFALGTDTAGSGRVPAAFNNLVGWKPTKGLLSTRGLVPACRSLDCVSVFALTCADAAAVAAVVAAYDEADPYSRPAPPGARGEFPATFRFGVPRAGQLEFFGDGEAARLYAESVERLRTLGGESVEIDFAPFSETAALLYSGPWVAERLAAITPFAEQHPEALHPVTAAIIGGAKRFNAVDTFRAFYRLEELRRAASAVWAGIDVLLLPTTPTIYTHADLAKEPVLLNTRLGTYTNFVNLLDLSALAVPAGFRADGLPLGVTLMAPAFADAALLALGARLHARLGGMLGGTDTPLDVVPGAGLHGLRPRGHPGSSAGTVLLAVVGAHLSGQPLNGQLTSRGASLQFTTRTAADYRLYALANTTPPKPGLVRSPGLEGRGIEVEVWRLGMHAFGEFTAEVPPPLAIGNVVLADGMVVKGFVCEPAALDLDAREITDFGGWRAYRAALASGAATAG